MSRETGTIEDNPITDEEIERVRSRIGEEISTPDSHIEEATKDAIRHFCHGIGCYDPLYTDEEYAREGPFGEITAFPMFLYAASPSMFIGFPGAQGYLASGEWEWYRRIKRNDQITSKYYLRDCEVVETSLGGKSVKNTHEQELYNQDGQQVASIKRYIFRVKRVGSDESSKYDDDIEIANWSEDDRERFAEHYENEERRGADPRYFEDVQVNDEIDTLLKGPYTTTQLILYNIGTGGPGFLAANRGAFKLREKLPALTVINEQGGIESPYMCHWDWEYAQSVGVPAPYDNGPERLSWLAHAVTHWAGDEAFLRKLEFRLNEHNFHGDVTWCSGEVIEKRVEDGLPLVDVSLTGENQRGTVTIEGTASVALPSRDGDYTLPS